MNKLILHTFVFIYYALSRLVRPFAVFCNAAQKKANKLISNGNMKIESDTACITNSVACYAANDERHFGVTY